MNIALISPLKNAYSETFIQAHKERLKGNIFYYYGGNLPLFLENGKVQISKLKRINYIFNKRLGRKTFSLQELALITSFEQNEIDLVFAEYGQTGQRLVSICEELQLPLIVHFHGYDASRKNILDTNNNYRELFRYARYVVVVSTKMHADFLKMGCPESKLVYNVYGPREDFLEVQPNFSKTQFIAIGRFTNKKAPYYLILSFKDVVQQFPKAKLIIAGDGELWDTCKNLVKYYELEENISLPGIINKEQYKTYLSESIAMVQHSITADDGDSEGTPVAILEASAAGLPVISTKHAGIPDVIIDRQTGLLVEEHDVKAMTANIFRVLKDKNIAMDLGLNAKENIAQNYTLERHITVLDELIEKTIRY
jgi:glycosyltransferase involved in cell wall biosynthesis